MTTEQLAADRRLAEAFRGRIVTTLDYPRPAWAEPMFLADVPIDAMVAVDVDDNGPARPAAYPVADHRYPYRTVAADVRPSSTCIGTEWFHNSRELVVWHITTDPPYIALDELDDARHYLGPEFLDVVACAICDAPIGPLLIDDAEGYERPQMVTPWLAYDVTAGTVTLVCEDCAVTYDPGA